MGESKASTFPWMDADDVDFRKRWREHYAGEQYSTEGIIEKALEEGEELDMMSQHYLFGRNSPQDCRSFVMVLGQAQQARTPQNMPWAAANAAPQGLETPALCKYIICGCICPDMDTFDGDGLKAMDLLYSEHLKLEENQPELARARAAVRQDYEVIAHERAKRMLDIYEKQIEETGSFDAKTAWAQIEPRVPIWITEIANNGTTYGFAIFKSSKFTSRPEVGYSQWLGVFDGSVPVEYSAESESNDSDPVMECDELTGIQVASGTVFKGHFLTPYWNLWWDNELVDEDAPDSIRERFATLEPSLEGKMSKTTFLVITSDCVPRELDENKLVMEIKVPRTKAPGHIYYPDLVPLFVWAHDVHWVPPAGMTCDEEGYQGRVKVDAEVIFSWFYYAREETSHTMKDLWRRAQKAPNQIWTAEASLLNRGVPVELI